MAEQVLSVEKRDSFGKNAARRTRRAGRVPGILYGDGKEPVSLAVDCKSVETILGSATGANTILDLELTGTKQRRPVMIHELQRHPVEQSLVHVDFVRINMERRVHVKVHVRLHGLPTGVKNDGGILEFLHREVSLECLPGDIPNEFPFDVTALGVGDAIRISDLTLDPAKYRVLEDAETVIAIVALPAAEKEAATAVEGTAGTEPEVVKKGKEKEGEGGAKAGDGKAAPKAAGKPEGKK